MFNCQKVDLVLNYQADPHFVISSLPDPSPLKVSSLGPSMYCTANQIQRYEPRIFNVC